MSKRITNDRRIDELIKYGRGRVANILSELFHEGAIEREEWLDVDLRHDLEQAIVEELDGSETEQGVEQLVESIVEAELDLEVVDDDDD